MKSIKNFINENLITKSNELIKAQGEYKKTMFIIQKDIDKMLQRCQELKLIEDFKTKVVPYNNGYEIKISFNDRHLLRLPVLSKQQEFWINNPTISLFRSVNLQPSSFFEDDLEKGEAYLEGQVFYSKHRKSEMIKFPLNSKKDIKTSCQEYINIIQAQIKDFINDLEAL